MKRLALPNIVCLFLAVSLIGCGGEDEPKVPETADGAVNYVIQNLAEAKPVAVWDAMPASYQTDVESLIHEAAGKLDAEMYDKSMATMSKAARVLSDKKDFFLNSPMFAQAPDKQELAKNWDTITGMLDAVVNSDIKTLEGLKTVDVRKLLKSSGAEVMTGLQNIPDSPLAQLAQMEAEVVETKETGEVVLKMTGPNAPADTQAFKQVEGRWIPAEMADGWADQMKEAHEQVAAMSPEVMQQQKAMVMMMLGGVDSVLDQLAAAKTQAEFDQQLMGLMQMFGGMMGGPGGMPAGPGMQGGF